MEYEKCYCPRSLDDIDIYEVNHDDVSYRCLSTLDSVTITRKVSSKQRRFKNEGPHSLVRILFYGTNGGLRLEFVAAIIEVCE